ncbi:hypothetical protein MKX01_021903 [Papaver californicum]|nr:hypothetical protein MKX01_021903 [Papaver californicum]
MAVCKICMKATPRFQIRNSTNKCSHNYCPKCITKHIAAKVKENITLIMDTISHKVLDRWESALSESSILHSDKIQHGGGQDDMLLIQLAEKKKCGSEFCYGCGAKWSGTHEAVCERV